MDNHSDVHLKGIWNKTLRTKEPAFTRTSNEV
jgi:hypothetical protein